eukprot:900693-Prymnesium_polylepis.1
MDRANAHHIASSVSVEHQSPVMPVDHEQAHLLLSHVSRFDRQSLELTQAVPRGPLRLEFIASIGRVQRAEPAQRVQVSSARRASY